LGASFVSDHLDRRISVQPSRSSPHMERRTIMRIERRRQRCDTAVLSAPMAVELHPKSAFATAQRRFDAAAEVIGLSDDVRRLLRDVKRELTVHFPIRMDDGAVRVFTGYR